MKKKLLIIFSLIFIAVILIFFIPLTKDYNLYYDSDTIEKCGAIFDSNKTLLAYSEEKDRKYSDDAGLINSMSYVLGNVFGSPKSGVQSVYIEELLNTNKFKNAFGIDKICKPNDIVLSIDAQANKLAYKALGDFDGVVLVYNYKTGQLLCDVSKSSENNSDLTNQNGTLTDNTINGAFVPGSVMKIVTAACILKNPEIVPEKFTCTGKLTGIDGNVSCKKAHGELDLKGALNVSCNCWFGNAAITLGAEKLIKNAEEFGFNQQLQIEKNINIEKSVFAPLSDDKVHLAWSAIGQASTRINPIHYISIVGAIANEGVGYSPTRISKIGNKSVKAENFININSDIAKKLDKYLRSNVSDRYGDDRFEGLRMAGKTGTAQTNDENSQAVFVGYSKRKDLPLAVLCIVENGGEGINIGVDISNGIMQYFLDKMTDK